MGTRTHTVYFDHGTVDELRVKMTEMRRDFELRYPAISPPARAAMSRRLSLVEQAIDMLDEPVPGPYE